MPPTPQRILFLRPDAYGDLCLFEPVLRLVRDAWPQAEIAVLIREPYQDVIPLLNAAGAQWLTTACDPYRQSPGDHPAALEALRDTLRGSAPDCLVAACAEQTWLEAAAAAFLPDARQVSLGPGLTDPLTRAALGAVVPVDWAAIYPQRVAVEPGLNEWEQNLRLAGALTGREAPRWWPLAQVPASAREQAREIVAGAGLAAGKFVACAAAGTANVRIKSWPAEAYGETLAWLENERGVRALLIGHVSEREGLEAVRTAARRGGAEPALWLGENGEMPLVAGLLEAARFYFGNDTGALHLAAALGRPVVSIFGGGHWPRFAPVAALARTLVQPLPCFGCGWDCFYADAPCVRTIATAPVRRALEEILDDAGGNIVVKAEGLDAGARRLIDAATPRLQFLRADSADRLRQVDELTLQTRELSARLQSSDADRDARQEQVQKLTRQLETSETDRNARLWHVRQLTDLLETSEADRAGQRQQAHELSALLAASDADRTARLAQVQELTTLLTASEADRNARLEQIDELAMLLKVSNADRVARLEQINELSALLQTSDADRVARLEQINELGALLQVSEADRAARWLQIEELTRRLHANDKGAVDPAAPSVEIPADHQVAPVESGAPGEHP